MTTKATHISRFFSTEDVANGTISVAKLSNIYTSNVIEHVNLYFTTQRARDSFSAGTGVSIQAGNISIGQPVYTDNSVSFNNLTLTGELRGPSTLVLDPAAIGDDTGTVQIRGNLQVDGTTTTINSTTLTVDDLNIVLAQGAANAAAASGAGISIDGANATLTYASSTDTWNVNKNLLITPGTANGVLYLNASKVATTGSALTFDENQLAIKSSGTFQPLKVSGYGGSIDTYFYADTAYWAYGDATGLGGNAFGGHKTSNYLFWQIAGSERMRLNTTGLGIGTNSPSYPLSISTTNHGQYAQHRQSSGLGVGQEMYYQFNNASNTAVTYASVYVEIAANTAGSHGGKLGLRTAQSGTVTTALLIDSSGRVGINENNPSLPLHISGTNGYPNSSGSTEVGFLTLRRKSAGSTHGLWMGVADASPWGSWLQSADAGNFAVKYPLLLNPRGGQVIIGGTSTYGAGTVALYVKGGTSGWAVFERSSKSLFVNANYSDLNTAAQVSTQAIDSMNLSLSARETLSDLYLTTNGNVGVGTTSPGTLHKLAVEGPSRIKRLQKQIYNHYITSGNLYVHVKTNLLLTSGGQVGMWVWRLYGYSYGGGKIVDTYYALHSDSSGNIYSAVIQNQGNLAFGTGMYKSSDNYLVLVGLMDNAYFFGFDVDVQHTMGYGYTDLSVSAVAQTASSTGAF